MVSVSITEQDVKDLRRQLADAGENVVQRLWSSRKYACIDAAGEVLYRNGYLPHGTTWEVMYDGCWFSVEKKDGHELAHYFHEGMIYGPNFLIKRGKLKGQWRSPKGKPKTPNGKYLYQEPNAPAGVRHWTEALSTNEDLYEEWTKMCSEILRR